MWSLKTKQLPRVFVINPGSTSTKVALFHGDALTSSQTVTHDDEFVSKFNTTFDQLDFRLDLARTFLLKQRIVELDAVVGRGGLLKPVSRGTFEVNDQMIKDARQGVQGEHVANLGCVLAKVIAQEMHCRAFVVDPVSVDEFEPVARLSGHPLIERHTLSHALNLRAAAYWAAEKQNANLEKVNYIIVHLGGGISVAALKNGRIIDVNDASSSGPFSPERSGSLPLASFANLCFSGKYSLAEVRRMIMGEGGMKAYLGTADMTVVEKRIQGGDEQAKLVFEAMVYQIAKEIGAMATVLNGKLQAIVLTGGLANSAALTTALQNRISFLGAVLVFPGELEMEAMAQGALRVLYGQEKVKEYI
jgi:butyrate kinase